MNEQQRIKKALEDKGGDDDPRVRLAKYKASLAAKEKGKEDKLHEREDKVAARAAQKKDQQWRVKTAAGRGGDKAAAKYIKKKQEINRHQLQKEEQEYEQMMNEKIERAERKANNADNPRDRLIAVKEVQSLEQEKRAEMTRKRKVLTDEKKKIEDHKQLVKDMDAKAKRAQDEALKQRRKNRMKASMDKVEREKAEAIAKEKAAEAAVMALGAALESVKFDARALYCSENSHLLFAQKMHDKRRADMARYMQHVEVEARPYLIIALQRLNKEAGLPCYHEGPEADDLRARRAAAQERLSDAKESLRKAISRKWGTEGIKREIQDADVALKLLLQQESELGPHAFRPHDVDKPGNFIRRLEAAKVQAGQMLFEAKAAKKKEAKFRVDEEEVVFARLNSKQQKWVKDYPEYHWRWYQVGVQNNQSMVFDGSSCNFYPLGPSSQPQDSQQSQQLQQSQQHRIASRPHMSKQKLAAQALAPILPTKTNTKTRTSKSQPNLRQFSLQDVKFDTKQRPAPYLSQAEWRRNELLKKLQPGAEPGYWHLQPEHQHLHPPLGRTGSDYQREHQGYMSREEYTSVLQTRKEERRRITVEESLAPSEYLNSGYW